MHALENETATSHLSNDRVVRGGHFVDNPVDSLQPFLILGGDAIIGLVIVLQGATLHTADRETQCSAEAFSWALTSKLLPWQTAMPVHPQQIRGCRVSQPPRTTTDMLALALLGRFKVRMTRQP